MGDGSGSRSAASAGSARRPLIEVVTTGVLLQRLQRDPELDGVDVVLLDECHERHLDADTALAFLLDVRATLRPDLRIIATSATADAAPWARLLGSDGPPRRRARLRHHAPGHPVWAPPPRPVPPPHGMRVDPAFLSHVADRRTACAGRARGGRPVLPAGGRRDRPGGRDALPASRSSRSTARPRRTSRTRSCRPGTARRVVLATSVAESSLTVPGVRIVVDSGLAREPRTDHARGLGSLTTVRASKASATQRAGRAGREAPGMVYRCWSRGRARPPPRARPARDRPRRPDRLRPAGRLLGQPAATGLALLDPPPPAAMDAARGPCTPWAPSDSPDGSHATDIAYSPDTARTAAAPGPGGPRSSGAARPVTARGRRMAGVGVHPRLARALIDVGPRAAEVVALLSEQLPRDAGDDLVAVWRSARQGGGRVVGDSPARWRQETERPARAVPRTGPAEPSGGIGGTRGRERRLRPPGWGAGSGRATTPWPGWSWRWPSPSGWPRRRGGSYLMASGTAAELPGGSRLGTAEWLAVAVADRPDRRRVRPRSGRRS